MGREMTVLLYSIRPRAARCFVTTDVPLPGKNRPSSSRGDACHFRGRQRASFLTRWPDLPARAVAPAMSPPPPPRIHPGYLRQLCLKLQHEGVPVSRLLAAGRLTMADVFQVDRPLPFDSVRRVLRAALDAAPRPSLALELGQELRLHQVPGREVPPGELKR